MVGLNSFGFRLINACMVKTASSTFTKINLMLLEVLDDDKIEFREILKLLSGENLHTNFGVHGRDRYLSHFSPSCTLLSSIIGLVSC